MAIFHLNAKVISRGKGQSAIAAAAYRSGERLRDEATGELKHYPVRAERIEFTDILAPKDAPEWAHDRNTLWNQAEKAEKRKDAQLAREFEIALPHELTDEQRVWLVKDFAREAFVRQGYAVDIAIHAPDKDSDERNHHAHLMVTMRTLGAEGFAAKKDRSLNSGEQLGAWREQWAHLANRHLERHGHAERIDHRSLGAQGIEREPTVHVGYAAKEMDARGAASDRMDLQRGVLTRNGLRAELAVIDRELAPLLQRQAGGIARAPTQTATPTPTTQRAAPVKQPTKAPIRVIGGIARPAGAARGMVRPAGGALKTAGKLAEGVATAFEGLFGGAPSKPKGDGRDYEKAPVDAGNVPTQAESDAASRQEHDQKSATRQKYLKDFSREVPDELQREADIERGKGRERERER